MSSPDPSIPDISDPPRSLSPAAREEQRKARPFEVGHGAIFRIAVPMTLAFATTPLVGLTDTAVVGRTGDAAALAGLTVGALIFDFAFATFNFLRSGTTGLTAQAFGRGDGREIAVVFWRAVILALGIGAALILLEPAILILGLLAVAPGPEVTDVVATYVFVRMFSAPFALLNYSILGTVLGLGRGGIGLALQAVVNGVNVVASIFFGLVLDYGVAGVAFGTVLGEALGAAAGLATVLWLLGRDARPSARGIFERAGFLRMIAVNRDIMIRSFCLLGAFVLFARFGASLGALTLAVNGILMNLFLLAGFLLDGLATAVEQLVGRALGSNWRPAYERAIRLALGWSALFAVLLSGLFLLSGSALVAFLTTDAQVRRAAADFLPYAALTPAFGVLAFLMDGVYIGATWSAAMRNAMIASFAVFALVGYPMTAALGNHGLWIALLTFLAARGVVLLALLPRRTREAFGVL